MLNINYYFMVSIYNKILHKLIEKYIINKIWNISTILVLYKVLLTISLDKIIFLLSKSAWIFSSVIYIKILELYNKRQ